MRDARCVAKERRLVLKIFDWGGPFSTIAEHCEGDRGNHSPANTLIGKLAVRPTFYPALIAAWIGAASRRSAGLLASMQRRSQTAATGNGRGAVGIYDSWRAMDADWEQSRQSQVQESQIPTVPRPQCAAWIGSLCFIQRKQVRRCVREQPFAVPRSAGRFPLSPQTTRGTRAAGRA